MGAAPRVRAVKSSEFGEGECENLDGPIWSRCSIVLTCLARSHFQRTLNRERWGQGWDERYRSSRKEEEGDKGWQEKGRRKEKTGDRF